MANAMAMIMAGGSSPSMSILTEIRSEPAVHFGGKFRIIDFSLSNCVNSDIYNVAVLTQYKPRSLNDHIGIGKPWDLDRATGGVRLCSPIRAALMAAGKPAPRTPCAATWTLWRCSTKIMC